MAINLKGSDDSSFSNSLNVRDINAVNTGQNSIFLGYDGDTLSTQIWANGTIITTGTITADDKGDFGVNADFTKGVRCNPETSGTSLMSVYGTGSSTAPAIQVYDGVATTHKFRVFHDGSALFTSEVTVKQELSPSFASPAFSVSNASQDEVIRLNNDGSASFNGDVTAANITSFKTTLTNAVASAGDLAALKTAITNALAQL